ncbi:hypothetical protein P3W45_000546 [Vairimorpha bombi]|jgi:tRNA splicing endonuclease
MSKPTEKQIQNRSLKEVVNYLNTENKVYEEDTKEEVEIYSKKKIRQMTKKGNKRSKVQNNDMKYNNDKSVANKDIDNYDVKKDTEKNVGGKKEHKIATNNNESEKLTRRERRKLKIENKGDGISSKEYMKIFKETSGRKIEREDKSISRMHMPSRSKSEVPKSKEKPKKRFKSKKPYRK